MLGKIKKSLESSKKSMEKAGYISGSDWQGNMECSFCKCKIKPNEFVSVIGKNNGSRKTGLISFDIRYPKVFCRKCFEKSYRKK